MTQTHPITPALFERLGEDGLVFTTWLHPSRGWGHLKRLLVVVDKKPLSAVALVSSQSFSVFSGERHRREELDDGLDHYEAELDLAKLPAILDLLEGTRLRLGMKNAPSLGLGGTFFGLSVEWRQLTTDRRWYGHREDTDEDTLALWNCVDGLVADP